MAREVYSVYTFVDENNQELKSIEISEVGLTNENNKFMVTRLSLTMNRTDELLSSFIKEVIMYKILVDTANHDELEKYIPDFDSFIEELNHLHDTLIDRFPNKFEKVEQSMDNIMVSRAYNVNAYGTLYDLDFKEVIFTITGTEVDFTTQTYSLIPEFADKMYELCNNFEGPTEPVNKIIILNCVAKFFDLMYDEYHDSKWLDKKQDILEILEDFEEEYPEETEKVKDNLGFRVFETVSPCNEIYQFGNYVITKLIDSKRLDLLDKIKDVLLRFQSDDGDYKSMADEIGSLLLNNDLEAEHHYFQKIRNEIYDLDVIHALFTEIASWVVRDEYKNLVKEVRGESRTQE